MVQRHWLGWNPFRRFNFCHALVVDGCRRVDIRNQMLSAKTEGKKSKWMLLAFGLAYVGFCVFSTS